MAFSVKHVDWRESKRVLSKLREQVFVYEWHIPRECEFDQRDINSHHVLILNEDNTEVATGRITPEGELGHLAVIPKFRQVEVYRKLLNALLDIAKIQGIEQISIQCELDAVEQYQKQGFVPVGTVYMLAGMPRQRMSKAVGEFSPGHMDNIH